MIILGITASSDRNAPDAPTIGTATNVGTGRAFNNGRADITFTAPSYTGGSDIVSYTVTSSPGGFTGTGSASPISVTGLQSGVAYTFTVTATNAAGFTSAASAASNSITATTVPQAPTIGTATDGGTGTSVNVAFTAGATGGSAITTFTATSSPGSITGTAASSPITVTGLTTGTAYTFTVTATNANGTSLASAASNSVTPQAASNWERLAVGTGSGVNEYIFSGLSTDWTRFIIIGTVQVTTNSSIGVRFDGSASGYNNQGISMYSGNTRGNIGSYNQSIGYVAGWNNSVLSNSHVGMYLDVAQVLTTQNKTSYNMSVNSTGSSSQGEFIISNIGLNQTGNVISSISIRTLAGNFTGNTYITIYGVKA